MLFEFHPHFDEFEPAQWQAYTEHLTNLLEAHRTGRHVYWGSRRHLNTLAQCDFLGQMALRTVGEIQRRYVDYVTLRNSLPRIVQICDFSSHARTLAGNIFSVSIHEILQPNTLAECHVLVENAVNDGAFWQLIFRALEHTGERLSVPNLKFVHCGGGTMADIVEHHATSGIPIYCIADSDRRSRFGSLGNTAGTTERKLSDLGFMARGSYGLSQTACAVGFRVLPVREAENLVPLDILRRALEDNGIHQYQVVERLVPSQPNLGVARDTEIWAYYDTKSDQPVGGLAYACADEQQLFEGMVARVGDPLPHIWTDMLAGVVRFCSGRHESKNIRLFALALEKSPFFPAMVEIAKEITTVACRPQARFT